MTGTKQEPGANCFIPRKKPRRNLKSSKPPPADTQPGSNTSSAIQKSTKKEQPQVNYGSKGYIELSAPTNTERPVSPVGGSGCDSGYKPLGPRCCKRPGFEKELRKKDMAAEMNDLSVLFGSGCMISGAPPSRSTFSDGRKW